MTAHNTGLERGLMVAGGLLHTTNQYTAKKFQVDTRALVNMLYMKKKTAKEKGGKSQERQSPSTRIRTCANSRLARLYHNSLTDFRTIPKQRCESNIYIIFKGRNVRLIGWNVVECSRMWYISLYYNIAYILLYKTKM